MLPWAVADPLLTPLKGTEEPAEASPVAKGKTVVASCGGGGGGGGGGGSCCCVVVAAVRGELKGPGKFANAA